MPHGIDRCYQLFGNLLTFHINVFALSPYLLTLHIFVFLPSVRRWCLQNFRFWSRINQIKTWKAFHNLPDTVVLPCSLNSFCRCSPRRWDSESQFKCCHRKLTVVSMATQWQMEWRRRRRRLTVSLTYLEDGRSSVKMLSKHRPIKSWNVAIGWRYIAVDWLLLFLLIFVTTWNVKGFYNEVKVTWIYVFTSYFKIIFTST